MPQRPEPAGLLGAAGWSPSRPRVRWVPARRAVVGVAVVLLVAVLVAVLLVWQAQPSAEAAPVLRRGGAGPVAGCGDLEREREP